MVNILPHSQKGKQMKYMIDIPPEVADIIVPQLETSLGVKLVKVVNEEPPARKTRRKTWRTRRAPQNPYPHKSYKLVGNYYHVYFDGPCDDAQTLKLATAARWDGIHGYWYCPHTPVVNNWFIANGYKNLDEQ